MRDAKAEEAIETIYERNQGNEAMEDFFERHGIASMAILTITSQRAAEIELAHFKERIAGKIVIEIGAGVGFLAMETARYAKQVFAIEVDPSWSWVFCEFLYALKPENLTWIFGTAESVSDILRGDVAVVYSRSGLEQMRKLARKMCPRTIQGPFTSIDERYPDVPKEIRDAAESFANKVSKESVVSRHGVSGDSIRAARQPL